MDENTVASGRRCARSIGQSIERIKQQTTRGLLRWRSWKDLSWEMQYKRNGNRGSFGSGERYEHIFIVCDRHSECWM